MGATIGRRVLHFVADGTTFLAMIAPIVERLRRRGVIPADARVVSLAEAPADGVARLVSATFGNRYDAALTAARHGGPGGYDRARSAVLLVGGEVQGALLYRWGDGTPLIDVNVVAPALRRGWANALLLEAATRKGLAGGAQGFRFHCDDGVLDTINLARRVAATPSHVQVEWTVLLAPHAAVPCLDA